VDGHPYFLIRWPKGGPTRITWHGAKKDDG
jgi:hypothetical protein